MPNIKTKFTLDGEKEYKAAIREIGDGMRVLDSEMHKVSTAYAQNADSVEALNAKNDVLERQISTQKEKIEKLKEALQQSAQKYGEADKRTMQWQTSLNNAEAELNKLNNQVDENNQKIAETGEGTGNLGDIVSGLTEKFGIQLPDSMKKSINSMGSIDAKATAIGGAFVAMVAAIVKVEKALINMTKEAASAAKELEKLASTTGMSTETLQEFAYASEMIGVSTDQIADALKETTNKMQEARDGSEDAAAAYSKLGVTITDTHGNLRDAEEVFYETIDALREMDNATERDAIAMDLLSETAQQLNPLIEIGSEGLAAYAAEAHEVGYVLDSDMLEALTDVDNSMQKMQKTQEGVTKQLSAEFAPYLEHFYDTAGDGIKDLGDAVKRSGIVDAFGMLLDTAIDIIVPADELSQNTVPRLTKALRPLAEITAAIADAMNFLSASWDILTLGGLDIDKYNAAWAKLGKSMGFDYSYGNGNNYQTIKEKWQQEDINAATEANGYGQYYANGKWYSNYDEYLRDQWEKAGATGTFDAWKRANGYNAPGTDNWVGGFTTVAENGPERIYLPSGSRVQTASETRYTGGGSAINIERVVIDAKNIKQLNDLIRIFENERITARMGVR